MRGLSACFGSWRPLTPLVAVCCMMGAGAAWCCGARWISIRPVATLFPLIYPGLTGFPALSAAGLCSPGCWLSVLALGSVLSDLSGQRPGRPTRSAWRFGKRKLSPAAQPQEDRGGRRRRAGGRRAVCADCRALVATLGDQPLMRCCAASTCSHACRPCGTLRWCWAGGGRRRSGRRPDRLAW